MRKQVRCTLVGSQNIGWRICRSGRHTEASKWFILKPVLTRGLIDEKAGEGQRARADPCPGLAGNIHLTSLAAGLNAGLPDKELNSLNNAIVTNMVYFLKMFNRSQLALSAASVLSKVSLLDTFLK